MNDIGRSRHLDRTSTTSSLSATSFSGPNSASVKTKSPVESWAEKEKAVEKIAEYKIPDIPSVDIDGLFKRTESEPALYYLPVSKDEVEKRRLARMK
jgi:hypothetical protein